MARGPHGIVAEAYRPVVAGRRGMVCSGHPLASQAGISILQRGGTASDAALAVAAALGVVEPNMSGLGGDGFIMIFDASTNQVKVVNATGPAPMLATREAYLADGIPMRGIRSVSVPGLVGGWFAAHRAHGRLSVGDCFEPAIDLAERGFPVSNKLAEGIAADAALLEFPASRAIFTHDGVPVGAGEVLVQRDLADSLRRLASDGPEAFYHGAIARAIAACSDAYDGLLRADDLARFSATWQEPISVDYRGSTVYEAPPNSSGHVLLQMLNLVERYDLPGLGTNSVQSIHLMVEAKKLAFADREAFLADPAFADVPVEGLISKAFADERAVRIDPNRATTRVQSGDPWHHDPGRRRIGGEKPSDTTCFVVADQWGNAVCQLQSIQSGFGSGLVAPGTGILLNNRMTYWHLDPEHVDCLAPGKRVRHTMNPVMVTRQGRLVLLCGTPGADTQVQTNLQVLSYVLDSGFNVVEAVEAPRWRDIQDATESTIPHTAVDELLIENRLPEETRHQLRRRGHAVRSIGPWEASGSEVIIQIDPTTGAMFGAADPRRDGYAIGW